MSCTPTLNLYSKDAVRDLNKMEELDRDAGCLAPCLMELLI